jgi:hypothetical protein
MKSTDQQQTASRTKATAAIASLTTLATIGGVLIMAQDGTTPTTGVPQATQLAQANTPIAQIGTQTSAQTRMSRENSALPQNVRFIPEQGIRVARNQPASTASLPALRAAAHATVSVAGEFDQPADFVPNSAQGDTENAPFARISLPAVSNGQAAIDALGPQLPAVAAWYGFKAEELSQLLLSDNSVHLDRKGRLLHIDQGVQGNTDQTSLAGHSRIGADAGALAAGATANADIVSGNVGTTSGAPLPLDQTFALHSRSSSSRVVYLNFKGEGSKPAFSLDTNTGTFSDAEKQMIQKIWLRVAEDYSAFDVDITTELPTNITGKTGVTILITNQNENAGGYAYLNAFSTFKVSPAPAFCFQNNLANAEKPIAECLSHEVGHTLGLHHQSTASVTYYGGSGDGETGWAPIMGVSYYKNLTQWAKGEFPGATNTEDAYAVMAKQGLNPRADDHGNTRDKADPLARSEANGLANLSGYGVIETPLDVDVFSFVAGAGDVSLKVGAAAYSGNLDVTLELQDASGKSLATGNPADQLGATISTKLSAAGTYYLLIKGTGKGDPKNGGYSNYGSIGQYNISGTAALGGAVIPTPTPKPTATPTPTPTPKPTATPTPTPTPKPTATPTPTPKPTATPTPKPTATPTPKPTATPTPTPKPTVTPTPTPKAPVVAIKISGVGNADGVTMTFDGSASSSDGSKIVSYLWSLGDGNATATTAVAKYTYKKAGNYQVSLKVTDARGTSATQSGILQISAPPTAK